MQRGTSSLERLSHCRRDRAWDAEWVGIVRGDQGAAYAGLQTCESPHACPVCSAVIRHERALKLSRAVMRWADQGGGLLFPTLTLAHLHRDSLDSTLGHLLAGWAYVRSSRAYKRLRERYGIRHVVRALETTHGRNGWHPHLHCLFFTAAPLSEDDAREVWRVLWELWSRYAERHQLRALAADRAVTVRRVSLDSEAGLTALGEYLSKVQDGYGIAREVVRGDLKKGRKKSRTPFEIAESACNGNREDLRLWREYEQATRGRHVLEFSPGAKDALGWDDDEDQGDDDAGGRDLETVYEFTPYEWGLAVQYRRRGHLLNVADSRGTAGVAAALDALGRRHRAGGFISTRQRVRAGPVLADP